MNYKTQLAGMSGLFGIAALAVTGFKQAIYYGKF